MASTSHHLDPKVLISIPATGEKGGERDVPVPVNGNTFTIRRDTPVEVPYRVYEALKNAVQTTYEQRSSAPDRPPEIISRDSPSYPFSVLRMPPAEEIRAWRERTDSVFCT